MAKPAYTVLPFDLTTLRDRFAALAIGAAYSSVAALQLPAGANVSLAFGTNSQNVPLLVQGQGFNFEDECGNPFYCDEGLFVTNPAGAGILLLLVGFRGTGGGSGVGLSS